jgi:hypothetical protein
VTCLEALTRYLEDAGAADEHWSQCRACGDRLPSLERLRTALADEATWEEPSPVLAEVVMAVERPSGFAVGAGAGWRRWWAAALVALAVLVGAGSWAIVRSNQPDWRIALAPRGATTGSATVAGWNTPTGTKMVLEVTDLEEAPPSRYYEVWLTSPDGRHVSAGTFRGPGRVTTWAGVHRSEFPRIWITLESTDDPPGPSRDTYFDTEA